MPVSNESSSVASRMSWHSRKGFKKLKPVHSSYLTGIFFLLLALGMANLYSAGAESAYFKTQSRHLVVALVAFVISGWMIPIRLVRTYASAIYLFVVFSLIIVLALGHTAGGSQRWLTLGGPLRFQPSEIAKIGIAIAVANWFYVNKLPHA